MKVVEAVGRDPRLRSDRESVILKLWGSVKRGGDLPQPWDNERTAELQYNTVMYSMSPLHEVKAFLARPGLFGSISTHYQARYLNHEL